MDSNIGKKLDGRYELLELIGVGGMADIYRARDIVEDRIVAVKILKTEFAGSDEFLRRFRNESKAIALLSHPNIVKIYDVGFTDKVQFIVMEYVDGITLTDYIEQQGVLKWRDAVHFTVQILKALQHAHDRGIVHRDIKSSNVMLLSDGTIKVMDFGIARFNRENNKTVSEKTIGSVHYISPEQARELYRLAEEKHLFLMEAFWIWLLPLYDRLRQILAAGTIGELKQITCQYGFVASGARKDRKFDSGLGGGALLDIGIYNLGFLRILTGQDPEKVETKEVHINEYGTDDYSRLVLTYPGGCKAESVQTIGQELERNARIVGTKGSIFLPDFQHAETMTLEVEGKEPEVIRCPVDINGFEYEIREASRCVKLGRTGSDRYTPQDSLALTRLMYDTRMSWGMKFAGEV